ncbi:unnamed protein product [Sphagnum jensenii]
MAFRLACMMGLYRAASTQVVFGAAELVSSCPQPPTSSIRSSRLVYIDYCSSEKVHKDMQEKFASLQVCRELLDMSHDVGALPELFCTSPAMGRRVQGLGLNPFVLTIGGIVSGQPVHILIKPDLRWMGHTASWN